MFGLSKIATYVIIGGVLLSVGGIWWSGFKSDLIEKGRQEIVRKAKDAELNALKRKGDNNAEVNRLDPDSLRDELNGVRD